MSRETPEPLALTSDQKYDLLEAIEHLKFLEPIAQSLSTLAEAGRSTTPQQPSEPERPPVPQSEVPARATPEEITLPDGRTVPTNVVSALAEYDAGTWPGSVLPEARAAVASVVIREVEKNEKPALRTDYPFCLDEAETQGVDSGSPCIKRSGHPGKHQDNNDGVW